MHSAIYEGWVRHRRRTPRSHRLKYKLFMMYLDLDELPSLFEGARWWSVGRRNLASWRRSDYLGHPDVPLPTAIRQCVQDAGYPRPEGPIRMLTHLRYWGLCFNPVTFYYCFSPSGDEIQCVVAEITNTPWRERHRYVLSAEDGQVDQQFDKAFHVSPFMAMERRYHWRFLAPGPGLWVHMDATTADGERELDASLCLRRRDISPKSLNRALLRHPFMTAKVVTGIHWEALKLWLKRVPVFDHPHNTKT